MLCYFTHRKKINNRIKIKMMIKKIIYPLTVQTACLLILLLLYSISAKAQSNYPILSWDQQVGCIEFDDSNVADTDFGLRADLIEAMNGSKCLRFCAGSRVTYKLEATNIKSVQWQVAGGALQSSSNSRALVLWGGHGNGALTVSVNYTSGTSSTFTYCIEKIVNPEAVFKVDSPYPDQLEFCAGSPISFDNLSNDRGGAAIINYQWNFGDGNTSNLFAPVHTYQKPGYYKVVLTATNSCNCSSTYAIAIKVVAVSPVVISCSSVACEGSKETYSVNEGCGGEWRVEGGTILKNYGNSIDVRWDQVDSEKGFGTVSYRSHCSCPFWNTIKIPIVLNDGIIKGPRMICMNKQGRFTLPQWPSTEFKWNIGGISNHPAVVLTDQHNEIVINGADLAPGYHTLSVEYRNTLINNFRCKGYANYRFKVMPTVEIRTDPALTVCQGTVKTFTTADGSSINWTVTYNSGLVHSSIGRQLTYTFVKGGSYVVGTNANWCIDAPIVVDVIAKPAINGYITGPQYVCLNTPYTYKITDTTPDVTFIWSVIGGSIIGSNAGTEVSLSISNPSAVISVVKQVVKDGVICLSDPASYTVSQVVVDPDIVNNNIVNEFCTSNVYKFSANLHGIKVDHIEWSIVSSTNQTNFGNIVGGINSPNVEVSFNEASSSYTGILTLKVTKCNVVTTTTRTIKLLKMPVLTIAPIADVCPGSGTITLNITSSPPVSGIIKVGFDGAIPSGSYSFTSGVPLVVGNGFANNTSANITKSLSIQLEKPNGCNYVAVASGNVTIFPATKIDITPGYHHYVCPTNYISIPLSATLSTGITASVSFQWYRNGNFIPGANSSNYTITGANPDGLYRLEVRDRNGCTVNSKTVHVEIKCSNNPDCTVTPAPNMQLSATWDSCDVIKAQLTYVGTPTNITWQGSSGVTSAAANNTAHATFNVSIAGNHTITAILNYNNCIVHKSIQVSKKYEPILKSSITCNSDGTYNIVLLNNSNIYGLAASDMKYTYIGYGITGTTGGDSHTISNVPPGNYTYTLSARSGNLPLCSTQLNITLDPEPETAFSVPGPFCSESAISLTVPGTYKPENRYEWHFSNTHYVASGPTTLINIASTGAEQIILKIKTPYGCVYQTLNPVDIVISKAQFMGEISPNSVNFCEGTPFVLSYTPDFGSTLPVDIVWMRDDEQVASGLTYTPTVSGSYWPVLQDIKGCKDYRMATQTRNVLIRKPPFASINGNTSICAGERVRLSGIITEADAEHRWIGPYLPGGYTNWVTGNANLLVEYHALPAGIYTYTLSARAPQDPNCVNNVSVTIVVHEEVKPPTIDYSVVNCTPYTLKLTANGPSTGVYNWSNGQTGRSIEVTHGGAYGVTYTSQTGCTASSSIQAPNSPERALWVVPTGCYDLCLGTGAYLIGPIGIYNAYRWTVDGKTVQSGSNTFVHKQPINTMGDYQLEIDYEACTFGSGTMNVTPAYPACPSNPCKIFLRMIKFGQVQNGFVYQLLVNNTFGGTVTMHVTSQNNLGVFSPATTTLNPGANTIMLEFYPNANYQPGAQDVFVIQMAGCHINVPTQSFGLLNKIYEANTDSVASLPQLTLTPNPATENTVAHFDIGSEYIKAEHLVIYDLLGMQRARFKLSGTTGTLNVYVGNLIPGTYLISLEADGKRIAEQKLIKK